MKARQRHLNDLSKVFGLPMEYLKRRYSSLKQIEQRGHEMSEKYCNGEIDSEKFDKHLSMVRKQLQTFFKDATNRKPVQNLYLNGDPRGYFLKLDNSFMKECRVDMFSDWGGYGILCPDNL